MAREFEDREELVTWSQSLDERWPERHAVMHHIGEEIQKVPFACVSGIVKT